ncbi:MAG: hypothetical protein IPJ65_39095 [Archangiaceae bacterium]|nr:hypothetical protein [Archangiaceae bacterium]
MLEHAEKSSLSLPRVLTARILALIALREAKAAFDAYRAYLEACRAAGGFNLRPPLDALELFFETGERARLGDRGARGRRDGVQRNLQPHSRHRGAARKLHSVSITLDVQLESASGPGPRSRAPALKACVLTKLGQKTEALKFWKKAKGRRARRRRVLSTNSLLA